jgi:hypothetical protein
MGYDPHTFFQLQGIDKEGKCYDDDWFYIDLDKKVKGNVSIPKRIDNRSGRLAHITEEVATKELIADEEEKMLACLMSAPKRGPNGPSERSLFYWNALKPRGIDFW